MQQPLNCGDSQPEPDVAIVKDALDMYADRPPMPNMVSLVVEVADASLTLDRRVKRAGLRPGGIVGVLAIESGGQRTGSLQQDQRAGADAGLSREAIYRAEDKLSLVVGLDDLGMVKVRDLLP